MISLVFMLACECPDFGTIASLSFRLPDSAYKPYVKNKLDCGLFNCPDLGTFHLLSILLYSYYYLYARFRDNYCPDFGTLLYGVGFLEWNCPSMNPFFLSIDIVFLTVFSVIPRRIAMWRSEAMNRAPKLIM